MGEVERLSCYQVEDSCALQVIVTCEDSQNLRLMSDICHALEQVGALQDTIPCMHKCWLFSVHSFLPMIPVILYREK
jgi:hypothetical protein